MTFRYIVYASDIRMLFKMSSDRRGELVWSSRGNESFFDETDFIVPPVFIEDGDFQEDAESLEKFIEQNLEKFL